MISHGKEIKVFAGNSNPELAEHICSELYRTLGKADVAQLPTADAPVSVFEPVRGRTFSLFSPPAATSTTTSWSCSS